MTLYLLTAATVTLALVLVMAATHQEVEVTPAGLVWLMIWGLLTPVGVYFLAVLMLGPPDDDDPRCD
ncbi:hypothetical protein ACU61A_40825 [Pseudonocardia sichuanensis]